MITLKTAVLLACSLEIGAILAGASQADATLIYDFGKNLGIAFQLHDDILDVYADAGKFGKQVGGDILANKKTFLLLTALSTSQGKQQEELTAWITKKDFDPVQKVKAVKAIYESLHIRQAAEKEMEKYFQASMESFEKIQAEQSKKEILFHWAQQLMQRES